MRAVVVFLSLLGLLFLWSFGKDWIDLYNSAIKEKDNSKKIALLLKAQKQNPKSPEVANSLGLSYRKAGQSALAEKNFLIATSKRPDKAEYQTNICSFYIGERNYSKAEKYCKHALSLSARSVNYYYVGETYNGLKQYNQALAHYKKAIKISPSKCAYYTGMAAAYNGLGKNDLALSNLERATGLCKGYVRAYEYRARIYLDEGEYEQALEDFNRVIAFETDNTDARLRRSYTQIALGECGNALDDVEYILKKPNPGADAYFAFSFYWACRAGATAKPPADAEEKANKYLSIACDKGFRDFNMLETTYPFKIYFDKIIETPAYKKLRTKSTAVKNKKSAPTVDKEKPIPL